MKLYLEHKLSIIKSLYVPYPSLLVPVLTNINPVFNQFVVPVHYHYSSFFKTYVTHLFSHSVRDYDL